VGGASPKHALQFGTPLQAKKYMPMALPPNPSTTAGKVD